MKYCMYFMALFAMHLGHSQLLYAEMGQSISSFEYQNSAGGTLDNLQSATNSFLGFGYTFQLPNDKLNIDVGLAYTNYGAKGSDEVLDNFFEWDVSYAGLQTGITYYFARSREFQFYASLNASLEYLLRGTQTLNNQIFNLSGEDEFDNFLIVPRAGVGIQYPISNKAALYVQYHYGKSYSLVNSNPNDDEKLSITTHNLGIGITIQLPGCNCSFKNF
ncbi:MAG: autotransporter outer membrane beta-barrel domain-containing protein [Flavobacteriaceae bacterium]